MKEITKMSRLTGQLEKLFNLLNQDWFDGTLEPVIITVSPSSTSYGHYSTYNAWSVKETGRREINIASATLDRPIENVVCTMLHEMCHHWNDTVLHQQDCTRNGTYHNAVFKHTAETHGLIVSRTVNYGYSTTEPSDELLMWILENNIPDILICRAPEFSGYRPTGSAGSTGLLPPVTATKKGHSLKYSCPVCKNNARCTKPTNLICGDCMMPMVLEG